MSLDPRFATDVGLTESEIARACNVPFWVSVARASEPPSGIAMTSTGEKGQLLRRLCGDDVIFRGVDQVVETGSIESLPKSLVACSWNAEVTRQAKARTLPMWRMLACLM